MASFAKIFSGRKRESLVWKYFEYLADSNKSKCLVANKKTQKQCGNLLAGKNPTNLKSQLSTCHPEVVKEIATQTEQEKSDKRKQHDEGMLDSFTNKSLNNESSPNCGSHVAIAAVTIPSEQTSINTTCIRTVHRQILTYISDDRSN